MKRIINLIFTLCLLLASTSVISADELDDYKDDVYNSLESFSVSGISTDSISDIGINDAFNYIASIIKESIKKPIKVICTIITTSLIGCLISAVSDGKANYNLAVSLACFAGISSFLMSSIGDIISSVESVQAFLIGYVPIYSGLIATSGNLSAATSYSAILLYTAEGVSGIMSVVLKPLIACMLATSVMHSLSDDMPNISRTFKRLATVLIGFLMTIFLGVIGLQGLTGKYSGKIAFKAGKYLVSSFVPVIGSSLTESYQTVMSSLDSIRSTVGIFGVVIICVLMLIPALNAFIYKLTFDVGETFSALFSGDSISKLCRSLSDVYSMLLYTSVLYMMMLTVATGAMISLGRLYI